MLRVLQFADHPKAVQEAEESHATTGLEEKLNDITISENECNAVSQIHMIAQILPQINLHVSTFETGKSTEKFRTTMQFGSLSSEADATTKKESKLKAAESLILAINAEHGTLSQIKHRNKMTKKASK